MNIECIGSITNTEIVLFDAYGPNIEISEIKIEMNNTGLWP